MNDIRETLAQKALEEIDSLVSRLEALSGTVNSSAERLESAGKLYRTELKTYTTGVQRDLAGYIEKLAKAAVDAHANALPKTIMCTGQNNEHTHFLLYVAIGVGLLSLVVSTLVFWGLK